MDSPCKVGTSWFSFPIPAKTNSPLQAQNTMERDGFIKHRQRVKLIYNHMYVVPVGWVKEGGRYPGSPQLLARFV